MRQNPPMYTTTIAPMGGQLEKNFFETSFYKFKMIVLARENVFDAFRAI